MKIWYNCMKVLISIFSKHKKNHVSIAYHNKTQNWAFKKSEIVIMFRKPLVRHQSWLQYGYQITVNSSEEAWNGKF